jgi:heme/copper-type cytochrome/quinol oxidase subunit 2
MEIYTNWIKSIYGNIDLWIIPFLFIVLIVFFIYVGIVAYCVYKERKKHPWRY